MMSPSARLLLSDMVVLIKKDVLLLWRDRTLFFVILLWLSPFLTFIRPAMSDFGALSALTQPNSSRFTRSQHDTTSGGGRYHLSQLLPKASAKPPLSQVTIGVLRGKAPDMRDSRYKFLPVTREAGVASLRSGSLDLLAEFPRHPERTRFKVFSTAHIQLIYERTNDRSRQASEMFTQRVRELQVAQRVRNLIALADSKLPWVTASIDYNSLSTRDGALTLGPRLPAIAGMLMMACALVSSLVILIIVEENARHTMPLILVCAVDRRTVFLSKLAFCTLPTLPILGALVYRVWRALPASPFSIKLLSVVTAFGAGVLFIFIVSTWLVAIGSRSRSNIEAIAKVGGAVVIVSLLVALTFTALAPYTPGLVLFPLTNLVLCLRELISLHPNWWHCALALSSSLAFSLLLARTGALSVRTEQGLPGEVDIPSPKLNSLLLFIVASSAAVLLANFVGLPASIVYPSIGSLATIAIFAVLAAGIYRFDRFPLRRLFVDSVVPAPSPSAVALPVPAAGSSSGEDSKVVRDRIIFACLASVALSFVTSLAFSVCSPAGSVSSEMSRIEAVTRGSASTSLLFSFALLRALTEELTLRGILIRTLIPSFSPLTIILLMSALGAALHPLSDTWLLMTLLSATLTYLRLTTRSTIPCMVLHLAHTACLWLIWNRVVQ